jgi:hypothetical protein
MMVWALDLATRTGYAYGEPGRMPTSGALILKKPKEPRAVALGNLLWWLNDKWSERKPDLVVTEAPLTLQAFLLLHSSQDNVRMHHSMHGVVEAMCARFGITGDKKIETYPATYRKHFLGRANFGSREATKWEMVVRARLLGLMPQDSDDEDRADALGLHDWACATHGRKSVSTANLHLFGERPREASNG